MSNPTGKGMDWIKLYTDLPNHPKLKEVMLNITEADPDSVRPSLHRDVFGSLILLWTSAGKFFTDGIVHDPRDPAKKLARVCEWHGDSKTWCDALVDARLIEPVENGYEIHDWHEFTEGWLLAQEAREKEKRDSATRSANYRARMKEEKEAAQKEARTLRQQIESGYNANPPPPIENDPVTPKERDVTVTNGDERERTKENDTVTGASEKMPFSPPPEPAILPPLSNTVTLKEVKNTVTEPHQNTSLSTNEENVTLPSRKSTRDERSRHGSNGLLEESREEESKDKDKGEEKRQKAALSPVPHILGLFLDGLKAKGKEPPNEFDKKRMGKTIKLILLRDYTQPQIETAIENWFKSTWVWVTNEVGFNWAGFKKSVDKLVVAPMVSFNKTHSAEEEGRPVLNAEGNYNLYDPVRDKARFRKPITWKNE